MSWRENYQEVEYISFPRGAWINTGISMTNHWIEAKFNDPTYYNDEHWLGLSSGWSFHFTPYLNQYYFGANNGENNRGTWTAGIHELKYNYGDNHIISIDDEILLQDVDCTENGILYIGNRNGSNNFGGWVYYFKIWSKNDNAYVRNLIPVYRKSDNVVGFYDSVSEQFFENSGPGTLVAGPEVKLNKYLLRLDGKIYSFIDTEITELVDATLDSQLFINNGSDITPSAALLLTLSNPEILSWSNENIPKTKAIISAIPQVPQEIIAPVDASSGSILGINSVTTIYSGNPLLTISRDNGTTWLEYNGTEWVQFTSGMTPTVFDAADWSWIPGQSFLVKIILNTTADVLTSITFAYMNA